MAIYFDARSFTEADSMIFNGIRECVCLVESDDAALFQIHLVMARTCHSYDTLMYAEAKDKLPVPSHPPQNPGVLRRNWLETP